MSILDYFPEGFTPRESQVKALTEIEAKWDLSDVLVLDMDVGTGKSHTLQTIARWRASKDESSATLTPRVSLQQQYKFTFPDVVVLQGKGRYSCKDKTFKNCLEKKEVTGDYCKGCNYACDRATAIESDNGVFSIHSYLMLRSRKDNLLVDEAQSLYSIMSEQNTIKLWQHKVKYPNNMKEYGDVIIWLEKAIKLYEEEEKNLIEQISNLKAHGAKHSEMIAWITGLKEIEQNIRKYKRVLKGIRHSPTDYFIEHVNEPYRGKPHKALQIRPTTLEGSLGWLWPKPETKKVVLASGTLSELDLEKLGLDGLRVNWIHAPQAISTECRPIVLEFAGNMSYRYQDKSIPSIADKILELQARHPNTKGLVHTTYAISAKLKKILCTKSGIIWHDKTDKEDALQRFRKAPPGTIFIACGFSTGIDLSGPEFGYQILTKTPWPSKADKLIEYWYDRDFEWVAWMAAREIIQACGRVNRYDGDQATTYIIDNNFGNPKKNRRGFLMQFKKYFPKEFMERIK